MDLFETHRGLMFAIAYRMLGSAMEAEDIVQEAYLRYQHVPAGGIESPKAFFSTVVTRLCLNQLDRAQHQREVYLGPWLPEPILTGAASTDGTVDADSISMAFLVLLESLTPLERAVFLLREVFDYEYAEISRMVKRDEAACRQLFSRAKKHIADNRPRYQPSPEAHERLLRQFTATVGSGDMDGLMQLLAEDVTLWADGGGKIRGAATRPMHGRTTVATFILASLRLIDETFSVDVTEVNGEPAAVLRQDGVARVVILIEADDAAVRNVRVIGNPDKLGHL